MSDAAAAAEFRPYAAPARAICEGPYVGANLGYQWGLATNAASKPSGVAGGLQAGYTWQIGSFVFGGETDLQLSDADHRFAGWKFSNPWFGTMRARAGFATGNLLFYGTVGLCLRNLGGQEPRQRIGIADQRPLGGRRRGLADGELDCKSGISLRRSECRSFVLTGAKHGIESSRLRIGVDCRF